jgi:hypothetical protein
MSGKDCEESARVAQRIKAQLKACYRNARKAILNLTEYKDASYVEGMAVLSLGMSLEHAWVVRDGLVIDPTNVLRPNLPIVGYFPGLEVKGRKGIAEFIKRFGRRYHQEPFFYAFGWSGSSSKSFTASREAASKMTGGR